jgi:hypothetical protein
LETGCRQKSLSIFANPIGDALGGIGDLFRVAGKAHAQERLTARAEGRARRNTDADIIDQLAGQAARIGFAGNLEEQIERAVRRADLQTVERREGFCQQVAVERGAPNLLVDEPSPSLRATIAARCMKAATPEVEYWMRFSTICASSTGASSQPIRQPVIAQFFDMVLT